jgi:hypothetical protein
MINVVILVFSFCYLGFLFFVFDFFDFFDFVTEKYQIIYIVFLITIYDNKNIRDLLGYFSVTTFFPKVF